MGIPDVKESLATGFRQVQVCSSGDKPTPVKVTAAGNVTLIGLVFHPVLHLQPVPNTDPRRTRQF